MLPCVFANLESTCFKNMRHRTSACIALRKWMHIGNKILVINDIHGCFIGSLKRIFKRILKGSTNVHECWIAVANSLGTLSIQWSWISISIGNFCNLASSIVEPAKYFDLTNGIEILYFYKYMPENWFIFCCALNNSDLILHTWLIKKLLLEKKHKINDIHINQFYLRSINLHVIMD